MIICSANYNGVMGVGKLEIFGWNMKDGKEEEDGEERKVCGEVW